VKSICSMSVWFSCYIVEKALILGRHQVFAPMIVQVFHSCSPYHHLICFCVSKVDDFNHIMNVAYRLLKLNQLIFFETIRVFKSSVGSKIFFYTIDGELLEWVRLHSGNNLSQSNFTKLEYKITWIYFGLSDFLILNCFFNSPTL
jgi:hypothetical protein